MKKYRNGVEVTLEVIGGKWKSIILYHLTTGKKRTNELKKLIPDITPKMLTQQLRELEKDGIIHRTVYHEIPPRVEYELSEYGLTLKTVLDSFCFWGEKHLDKVYGDRSAVLEEWPDHAYEQI
ncbi:winged helix-turn-helix transcriptional regulator [Paenibacillus ehimensis]|uniref:Helix-turn-helix domain-containing protein n=1 Tax=Paenibacillus ehimensis TaxID=79264 RepID=A0ABT8V6C9_9BACL|nr:helix-turn-helix domain-containing protein [Paenibacillus ehimensis]MDO3676976.1 helix-turn-helix domain-containing protein [Paenibacillus ehimensis]MEC0208781.1 helix-turn-helix domain-containing protein [Paenibacillus ehimensis]